MLTERSDSTRRGPTWTPLLALLGFRARITINIGPARPVLIETTNDCKHFFGFPISQNFQTSQSSSWPAQTHAPPNHPIIPQRQGRPVPQSSQSSRIRRIKTGMANRPIICPETGGVSAGTRPPCHRSEQRVPRQCRLKPLLTF